MALNGSGPISLGGSTVGQSVNLELGFSATATIAMNTTAVRTLAGFPTANSQYSMSNFYGKSNRSAISYTFTSNTANASLNVSSIGGYSSGKSDITVTVNGGVYLWANSTGNYGLNLTGGTSGDTVTLVNNGYIIGKGGDSSSGNGGPALNVGIGVNITINNTNASAYIAGGGGGGNGNGDNEGGGGGGAGGGNGQNAFNTSGGGGGGIGATGGNGNSFYCGCDGLNIGAGGGGGRILPGSGGAGGVRGLGGGAGGGGGSRCGGGGNGGSSNNAGSSVGSLRSAGGGGWGAVGGTRYSAGGNGGKAVNLNGKAVTWVSGNTARVWGAVS